MSNPWKCTNSGTSVLLTTFTVTGTPSFIRSRGPGEVPLYPMVLRIRLGANSTVTGPISSVKSVLATSCGPAGARKDCGWPTTEPLAAATPAILRKSRLCIRCDGMRSSGVKKCRKPASDQWYRMSPRPRARKTCLHHPKPATIGIESTMSNASAATATDRLKKAFADALSLPPGTDYGTLAYASTPGWDSVAHMALVAEIENTFDIM